MDDSYLAASGPSRYFLTYIRHLGVVSVITALPSGDLLSRVTALNVLSLNLELSSDRKFSFSEGLKSVQPFILIIL